jgi:hypothetical protein
MKRRYFLVIISCGVTLNNIFGFSCTVNNKTKLDNKHLTLIEYLKTLLTENK